MLEKQVEAGRDQDESLAAIDAAHLQLLSAERIDPARVDLQTRRARFSQLIAPFNRLLVIPL